MRIIKRYGNRRLYDTNTSSTITLEDLATLVKDGAEIRIVDAKSNRDMTLEVLGRLLLFEASRWKDNQNSKELFKTLITRGGEKTMSLLKNTFLATLGAFQVTKEKAEKIIDDLIKKGDLDKSQRKQAILELLERADKSTSEWGKKLAEEAGKVQKDVSAFAKKIQPAKQEAFKKLEAKVDNLSKQLKRIEEALKSLAGK